MKRYILIIILAVVILFQYFDNKKSESIALSNIKALNAKIEYYKLENGALVASKKALVVSEKELKAYNDSLSEIIRNFKKPDVVIKYKWKLKTDTVFIPTNGGISVNNGDIFDFMFKDKWIELSGIVNDSTLIFYPPKISNEQSIVTGYKRKNIFKKKEYYVDISNSNPYIFTENMTTFKVDIRRSPLEKWWITVPVGIAVGAIAF